MTDADCVFYLDLMSHDLLNFNQAVLGYLELLLNNKSLDEDARHYLISAIDQVRNGTQLIEDIKKIANLTLIEESSYERFLISKVVEDAIEELKFLYPEIEIVVNLNDLASNAMVEGTEILNDVALDLLTNAVKFDKSEKVHIEVTISRPEGAPGMVALTVEDRGIGITDQMKQLLLGETSMENRSRRVRGMGLLLIRAAAKRFGGSLAIEDRVSGDYKQGARVIVRLPEVRGQ